MIKYFILIVAAYIWGYWLGSVRGKAVGRREQASEDIKALRALDRS